LTRRPLIWIGTNKKREGNKRREGEKRKLGEKKERKLSRRE